MLNTFWLVFDFKWKEKKRAREAPELSDVSAAQALSAGQFVRVTGLKAKSELNGKAPLKRQELSRLESKNERYKMI